MYAGQIFNGNPNFTKRQKLDGLATVDNNPPQRKKQAPNGSVAPGWYNRNLQYKKKNKLQKNVF